MWYTVCIFVSIWSFEIIKKSDGYWILLLSLFTVSNIIVWNTVNQHILQKLCLKLVTYAMSLRTGVLRCPFNFSDLHLLASTCKIIFLAHLFILLCNHAWLKEKIWLLRKEFFCEFTNTVCVYSLLGHTQLTSLPISFRNA